MSTLAETCILPEAFVGEHALSYEDQPHFRSLIETMRDGARPLLTRATHTTSWQGAWAQSIVAAFTADDSIVGALPLDRMQIGAIPVNTDKRVTLDERDPNPQELSARRCSRRTRWTASLNPSTQV